MTEKYCSNCCKNINASTFFLHERMCSINVKKCPKCNKPFTIDDLEDHIQEVHSLVDCEYCKKKFPKNEIDNHQKKCDSKMVPCAYCELNILLGELKEHQKACGAITEPCVKCNRYIQRKNMEKHLNDGCPPPKNDRRSVDVIRNENRLSLGKNNINNFNNINNNYVPININDYAPDELFFEDDNKKVDIKMHNNIKKPNLQIRPPSGKKLLNEAAKKSSSNILSKNNNNINNIFNKEMNNKPSNINNINNKENTNKNPQIKKPVKKEIDKAKAILYNKDKDKNKDKEKKADYFNKQNYLNKPAVLIKPVTKDNNNKTNNISMNNSRYNGRDNTKKLSSKPNFNITKGSMKISKDKDNEEEFRKTRDKLTFKEAKNISGKNMNNNKVNTNINKNNNISKNININNNTKNKNNEKHNKIINDEDYIANFNFGEVLDEEQLMQDIIEQSLNEQRKKK